MDNASASRRVECPQCKERIAPGSNFCPVCGAPLPSAPKPAPRPSTRYTAVHCPFCRVDYTSDVQFCTRCGRETLQGGMPRVPSTESVSKGRCPRCDGKMSFQVVTAPKKRSFLTILLYILLAMTIIGLVILIPLMRGQGGKTTTYAVCQSCGFRAPVRNSASLTRR